MSETIPSVPANPTPEQQAQLHLEFARLGLIVMNNGNDIAQISEIAANERHRAAMAAAQARHDAANGPMTLGDFAAALAARAPLSVTVDELNVATQARWAWLQSLDAPVGPPAPTPEPEPAPLPEDPVPVPAPPGLVPPFPMPSRDELDPPWYLGEMAGEFADYGQPQTIDYAIFHWKEYGKPKGRKGNANGEGWGPQKEFAPPGVTP